MADELLRLMLNRRPQGPASPDGTPFVPPAPGFRTMPWVTGGKEIGNILNELYRVAPELQGQVNRFGTAPTAGVFGRIHRSNDAVLRKMDGRIFDPMEYNQTSLMGLTSLPTKEIWLRNMFGRDNEDTIGTTAAHEMAHIVGHEHGPQGTDLIDQLWPARNRK